MMCSNLYSKPIERNLKPEKQADADKANFAESDAAESAQWIKNEVRRNPLFFGACIFAFGAAPVEAQDQENSRSRLLGVESSFLITNGLGEFGDLTGVGFGFTMGSTWMPKRNSGFGVRLDLSLNLYDRESTPTCLTDPCWIEGDVVTNLSLIHI